MFSEFGFWVNTKVNHFSFFEYRIPFPRLDGRGEQRMRHICWELKRTEEYWNNYECKVLADLQVKLYTITTSVIVINYTEV